MSAQAFHKGDTVSVETRVIRVCEGGDVEVVFAVGDETETRMTFGPDEVPSLKLVKRAGPEEPPVGSIIWLPNRGRFVRRSDGWHYIMWGSGEVLLGTDQWDYLARVFEGGYWLSPTGPKPLTD